MTSCRVYRPLAVLSALITVSLYLACGPKSGQADHVGKVRTALLRVVIIRDKTESAEEHGIPVPDSLALAPLVQFFMEIGGELAVGTIDSASEQPLVRLRIDIPPVAPVDSSGQKSNVFLAAKATAAYRKQLALNHENLARWQEKNVSAVRDFWSTLNKQLSKPAADRRTDVRNAVHRGNMFLSESTASWTESPRRFAILCTDGEDNIAAGPVISPVKDVTYIIVPGTREGCLVPLKPVRFESLPAAIDYVIACTGDTINSSISSLQGGQ